MTADSDLQPSPFTILTREEELRLWPLVVHACHVLQRLRYVDYAQAETDAAMLALKVGSHYSPAELQRAAFTAIPRGGLIVLGLLAYQLDLKAEQLTVSFAEQADLLFLIDDCALSGSRLQGTLPLYAGRSAADRRVVVAHLYSTPGLRTAVREAFPNVDLCLAAQDLAESEEEEPLSGRLHPGPSEPVAFAWNEPDLLVQTPFDKRPTHQWRFLPPHKCLNNRQALYLPPAPTLRRDWVAPEGVVYGWFDGILYLLDTRWEKVYRLDNLAADCWRAAAGYGNKNITLAYLHDQHPTILQEELRQYFEQTVRHFEASHLLNQADPS